MPKVSIIVPTYNRPGLLLRALNSIAEQSYKDYEVIVVNNGEKCIDGSLEEFRRGNPGIAIKKVQGIVGMGLAAARNLGIKHAEGNYIAFLDDDDRYYPDHLHILVNAFEGLGGRPVYTAAYRAHEELRNGNLICWKKDVPYFSKFDYDKLLADNFIPVLCVMVSKEQILAAGGFDESMEVFEDWDLWIRLTKAHVMKFIPKLTCEFSVRSGTDSLMRRSPLKTFWYLKQVYKKTHVEAEKNKKVMDAREWKLNCWRKLLCREALSRIEHASAELSKLNTGPYDDLVRDFIQNPFSLSVEIATRDVDRRNTLMIMEELVEGQLRQLQLYEKMTKINCTYLFKYPFLRLLDLFNKKP